jgi:hypothetical protein
MSDTSIEDQAALAIVFDENIRDLVRKHILEAFNDPDFMDYLAIDYLHRKLEIRSYGSGSFAQAVRGVIAQQMNKY